MAFIAAQGDNLVAQLLRKHADVGMMFIKAKFCLEPDIGCPFIHVPLFPQFFQSLMCKDALVAQAAVCQGSHGPAVSFVGAYIGIAERPVGAQVKVAFVVYGVSTVDRACRPADGRGTTVGAVNLIGFLVFHMSPPLCAA